MKDSIQILKDVCILKYFKLLQKLFQNLQKIFNLGSSNQKNACFNHNNFNF